MRGNPRTVPKIDTSQHFSRSFRPHVCIATSNFPLEPPIPPISCMDRCDRLLAATSTAIGGSAGLIATTRALVSAPKSSFDWIELSRLKLSRVERTRADRQRRCIGREMRARPNTGRMKAVTIIFQVSTSHLFTCRTLGVDWGCLPSFFPLFCCPPQSIPHPRFASCARAAGEGKQQVNILRLELLGGWKIPPFVSPRRTS